MGQRREKWGQEKLYGDGEEKPWPLAKAREKDGEGVGEAQASLVLGTISRQSSANLDRSS